MDLLCKILQLYTKKSQVVKYSFLGNMDTLSLEGNINLKHKY